MSAVKGFTIFSSLTLFSAAALHSSKRPATDFSQSALHLEHDLSPASVVTRAKESAKAAANLRPAALAGRVRQM